MEGPSLVRFFRVVSPMPPLMRETFVVAALVAAIVVAVDVERTKDVLIPLLVLQLFASSSGFAGPARRGYYDLLLTRGDSRVRIAVVHGAMSTAPGIAAWLGLAMVEAMARRGFPVQGLAGGTVAAMVVVSMLAWSCTVPLPRFSGAIGWLVIAVAATRLWPPDVGSAGGPPGLQGLVMLVNPAVMVGRALDDATALAAVLSMACGAVGVVVACVWISLADYPLEASQ